MATNCAKRSPGGNRRGGGKMTNPRPRPGGEFRNFESSAINTRLASVEAQAGVLRGGSSQWEGRPLLPLAAEPV